MLFAVSSYANYRVCSFFDTPCTCISKHCTRAVSSDQLSTNAWFTYDILSSYHDYNSDEKICKNEMSKEDERNGEPLAVWPCF